MSFFISWISSMHFNFPNFLPSVRIRIVLRGLASREGKVSAKLPQTQDCELLRSKFTDKKWKRLFGSSSSSPSLLCFLELWKRMDTEPSKNGNSLGKVVARNIHATLSSQAVFNSCLQSVFTSTHVLYLCVSVLVDSLPFPSLPLDLVSSFTKLWVAQWTK